MVDGVLLIGRSGVTEKWFPLYEALEILEQVHASLLGIILNGMVPKASSIELQVLHEICKRSVGIE